MTIENEELCMLEQLCYLDKDVAKMAGIADNFKGIKGKMNGKSVEEILKYFDDTAISNLEALGDKEVGNACISGKEWADILRYIKGNEKLKNLILTDTMENTQGTTLGEYETFSVNRY